MRSSLLLLMYSVTDCAFPADVRIYRPLSGMSDEEVRFFAEQVQQWPQDNNDIKRSGIDGLVEGTL